MPLPSFCPTLRLQSTSVAILQIFKVIDMNWKHIAQSEGYRSLKASYIKDVQTSRSRSKHELLKHFNWVINRAKHYAYHKQIPIEQILLVWEHERGSNWWLSYYQNSQQSKFYTSNNIKPHKKTKLTRVKDKKRWSMSHKKFTKSVS